MNLNTVSHNSGMSRDMDVVPGGNYTLSFWLSHDSASSSNRCGVQFNVFPTADNYGLVETGVAFRDYPTGGWHQAGLDFQALATYVTITLTYYCNVGGALGSVEGRDTFYLDDIEVLSRDIGQA